MKFCKGCQTEKPLADFSLAKRGGDGRAYYCRPCAAKARREYYARTATPEEKARLSARQAQYIAGNPEQAEKARQRSRDWYRDHPEVVKARSAAWGRANPEKMRAASKAQREKNPEKGLEYRHRRLARLAAAPVNDFTAADWREVLNEFNHACAYCLAVGVPLQQEHMQPISRGGSHTKSNIVPACGPCNMRKGARSLLQFLSVA